MQVIATGLDTWIWFATVSPNSRWLAASPVLATSPIPVWDLLNSTAPPMHLPPGRSNRPVFGRYLAFSPDSQFLAYGSTPDAHDGVALRPVSGTGDTRQAFPGLAVSQFAFTPNGRELLGLKIGGPAYRWDFATESFVPLYAEGPFDAFLPVQSLAFTPNGQRVALPRPVPENEQLRGGLSIREYPSGDLSASIRVDAPVYPFILNVTFSRDGSTLAGQLFDEVVLWDADTLAVKGRIRPEMARRPPEGTGPSITSPAFSPDGQLLAIGCYDGTVRFYDTTHWAEQRVYDWVPTLGYPEIYRPEDGPAVKSVVFTNDGTRAVAAYWFHLVVWDLDV